MSKKHDTKKLLYQNECVSHRAEKMISKKFKRDVLVERQRCNKIDFHFTFVFCSMHGPDVM